MIAVGGSVDLSQLDKTLAAVGKEADDLRPVFRRIDSELSQLFRDQFESRGARFATPWAPISEATIKVRIARRMMSKRARRRAANGAGRDTPLRDTNGLWASFTKPGAPGSVRIIEKMNYERGSSYTVDGFPVALAMQTGFKSTHRPVFDKNGDVRFIRRKGGPKQVAARPIVPKELPAPVVSAWEGYLYNYIDTGKL